MLSDWLLPEDETIGALIVNNTYRYRPGMDTADHTKMARPERMKEFNRAERNLRKNRREHGRAAGNA
jgi:hypothetical protein